MLGFWLALSAASLPGLSFGSIGRSASLTVRCSGDGDGEILATCMPYWPWRRAVAVAELVLSAGSWSCCSGFNANYCGFNVRVAAS